MQIKFHDTHSAPTNDLEWGGWGIAVKVLPKNNYWDLQHLGSYQDLLNLPTPVHAEEEKPDNLSNNQFSGFSDCGQCLPSGPYATCLGSNYTIL